MDQMVMFFINLVLQDLEQENILKLNLEDYYGIKLNLIKFQKLEFISRIN